MRERLTSNERILEKFWEFHFQNPQVYADLRRLALGLVHAGRKHYGIKSLFEVLRWERALYTTGSIFKLNNNYHALYARILMDDEPELAGFFSTRFRSPQIIE